jgi:hypothetical protein
MKILTSILGILLVSAVLTAQKVEYKDNTIIIDGKNVATVVKIKGTLGLINTYKIVSMSGDTLISAVYDDKAEENQTNNMSYYYIVTFITTNQVGIFGVSKLGTEKSLAKLIGKGEIIDNGKLDANKVITFIEKEGKMPLNRVDYTIVSRGRSWPIEFQTDKTIKQNQKTIGSFADATVEGSGTDTYTFSLPGGVQIASVNFTNGNNSQNCNMTTMKDNYTRVVPIPLKEHIDASASTIDRNYEALKRIVKWLVENQYL